MNLEKKDYIDILNYYGLNVNYKDTYNILKKKVENIIVKKMCSCINKVDNRINYKPYSIAICNNSVVQKKNLKINGFTCKKKKKLKYDKNNNALKKNSKHLTLKIKKYKKNKK